MMYSNQIVLTGVGTSAPHVLSPARQVWAVSVQTQVTGTATYDVEVTIDGINWVKTLTGLTASTASNIVTPCQGIRTVITGGTGTVTSTFLEVR